MKIENLTEANVNDLSDFLVEMQKVNPSVSWGTFLMSEETTVEVDPSPDAEISALRGEVALLRQKIELIFGNHILMDGIFQDLKLIPPKE